MTDGAEVRLEVVGMPYDASYVTTSGRGVATAALRLRRVPTVAP